VACVVLQRFAQHQGALAACTTQVRSDPRNLNQITLWLFNIAMGYGPFIDGSPIKNGDFPWLC